MKNFIVAIGGAAVGFLYVVIVGFLSVQVIGLQAGAVFDLTNTVVGVTDPQMPIWPLLSIVVLSALVIVGFVLLVSAVPRETRVALVIGFSVAAAVLVVFAFSMMVDRNSGAEQTVGVLPGWTGWVEKGGFNSAVHLVIVLAVASLWLRPRAALRPKAETGTAVRVD